MQAIDFSEIRDIPVMDHMKEPPIVEWLVVRGSYNLHALSDLEVVGTVEAKTETEAGQRAVAFLRHLMNDQASLGLTDLIQPGAYWVCRKPSEAIFTVGVN